METIETNIAGNGYRLHLSIPQKLNQQLISTIFSSRSGMYNYVNLAKCACSTIKASLWNLEYSLGKYPKKAPRDAEFVHTIENTPYVNSISANGNINPACYTFTLVRNPYTRVLSAYLDKIEKKIDKRFNQLGDVTFEEFLRIIGKDDPFDLDPHYRPQSLLSLVGFLNYDFIGKIENLPDDLQSVLDNLATDQLSILNRRPHATNAKLLLDEYYTKETIELVNKIFHDDFINFNYNINDFDQLAGEPVNSALFSDKSDGLIYKYIDIYHRHQDSVLDRFNELVVFANTNKCPAVIIEACQAVSNIEEFQIKPNVLKVLENSIEIECNRPQFYHELGTLLVKGGNLNGATKAYKKAISLKPKEPHFHIQLSRVLARKKDIAGALQAARNAIEINSANPYYYSHLGMLLQQEDNITDAIKAYKKAIALKPKEPQFHIHLSRAIASKKSIPGAFQKAKSTIVS